MENVKPEDIIRALWVIAIFAGFVAVIWNLVDKYKATRKPRENALQWRQETDEKLKRDKERIDALEDGQKVICRGILALLSHEINGNSTEKLNASRDEITNYLINR